MICCAVLFFVVTIVAATAEDVYWMSSVQVQDTIPDSVWFDQEPLGATLTVFEPQPCSIVSSELPWRLMEYRADDYVLCFCEICGQPIYYLKSDEERNQMAIVFSGPESMRHYWHYWGHIGRKLTWSHSINVCDACYRKYYRSFDKVTTRPFNRWYRKVIGRNEDLRQKTMAEEATKIISDLRSQIQVLQHEVDYLKRR